MAPHDRDLHAGAGEDRGRLRVGQREAGALGRAMDGAAEPCDARLNNQLRNELMNLRNRRSVVLCAIALAIVGAGCPSKPAETHPNTTGVVVAPPVVPHPTNTPDESELDGGAEHPTARLSSPCLSASGVASAEATVQMLAEFDRLMADFGPPPDEHPPGSTPAACLTEIALHNDPASAAAERTRAQNAQAAERAARAAYQTLVQDWTFFFQGVSHLGWEWDPRRNEPCEVPDQTFPAQPACCARKKRHDGCVFPLNLRGDWECQNGISREDCAPPSSPYSFYLNEWRPAHPAYVVPAHRAPYGTWNGQPFISELERRIQANGNTIHPESDQSCIVVRATISRYGTGSGRISCDAGDGAEPYIFDVPLDPKEARPPRDLLD